jgi:hypothetical protein
VQRAGIMAEVSTNSHLGTDRPQVFHAGATLQSIYSRRWKNTAVYGTSQVQTTIYCILDAFRSRPVTNIGFSLWKALQSRKGRGFHTDPGSIFSASRTNLRAPSFRLLSVEGWETAKAKNQSFHPFAGRHPYPVLDHHPSLVPHYVANKSQGRCILRFCLCICGHQDNVDSPERRAVLPLAPTLLPDPAAPRTDSLNPCPTLARIPSTGSLSRCPDR